MDLVKMHDYKKEINERLKKINELEQQKGALGEELNILFKELYNYQEKADNEFRKFLYGDEFVEM